MLFAQNYDRYYDFIISGSISSDSLNSPNSLRVNNMRKPGLEPGRVSPLDPKSGRRPGIAFVVLRRNGTERQEISRNRRESTTATTTSRWLT